MHSFFLILALLCLVAAVYTFAYRTGYRSAQCKALLSIKEVAEPVSCLIEELNSTIDKALDDEAEKKG